jgi:ribosomal-protein-alanine N-acetyltransferase
MTGDGVPHRAGAGLPAWPATPPAHGPVLLRAFTPEDADVARELSTDPYVPLIGTLPASATEDEAREWIARQQGRWAEGAGFSFAVAQADTGRAVGFIGLWLEELGQGRGSAGYAIVPSRRGQGLASAALTALTGFAWSIPALARVELQIEPWNVASIRVAERAGFDRVEVLRGHREIGGRRRDVLRYVAVRPAG